MSRNRIEIEEAKNGYMVTVWKEKDDEEEMYPEPEKLVAESKEQVMKLIEKHLD